MVVLNDANKNFLIQKKYYGSASEAFLRSEAALKIPVRKKYFFFKKFHCLWCPNIYLGGFGWYHFCFCSMTKNVKNASFQILSFWPKKLETMFSANLLIGIYKKFWAFWALEFLKYLKKWLIYKVGKRGGVKNQEISKSVIFKGIWEFQVPKMLRIFCKFPWADL